MLLKPYYRYEYATKMLPHKILCWLWEHFGSILHKTTKFDPCSVLCSHSNGIHWFMIIILRNRTKSPNPLPLVTHQFLPGQYLPPNIFHLTGWLYVFLSLTTFLWPIYVVSIEMFTRPTTSTTLCRYISFRLPAIHSIPNVTVHSYRYCQGPDKIHTYIHE